ncbi:serine/threonine-protein kinase [Amycolatopsis sp. NPDC049253]|uniref:serine/threonine-protein kinase n=1 Tax=Amycolatopsis sp. NPDC049253 TaxID=3155274 RepID=UPI003415F355
MEQKFEKAAIAAALEDDSVEYLGTGTFGESWLSHGRAIKIIHNPNQRLDRLQREIDSHQRIDHSNVVKLFLARSIEISGNRHAALEFEYIDGDSVRSTIAEGRPDAATLREFARGIISGLNALHDAKLIHRDVKPENIALRGGNLTDPVILDLGTAKLLDMDSITQYPTIIGTTMYMAPEQLRSERALKASDLWSAGVVIYELATGHHPFFTDGAKITLNEALELLSRDFYMPESLPIDLATLIRKLLSVPAYQRGTGNKALRIIGKGTVK